MSSSGIAEKPSVGIPPDDLQRHMTLAQPDKQNGLAHIGLVGDTYTIVLAGKDTNGRFCLIDMHIPPGGGPPPHRHDFEETFVILEGELESTFRGKKLVVRAGDTINIPSNAPHQFRNGSGQQARMLCVCSPAGQEQLFLEIGTQVANRTTPPPKPDEEAQQTLQAKTKELAPQYRTELLESA
ncbi:MAG: cupin domain-containing protein [Verrucomicrobia bacterium]|nr:cupin domain-containing protein [Verrucomicrobiota bacterium]